MAEKNVDVLVSLMPVIEIRMSGNRSFAFLDILINPHHVML